jgi:predicted GTPase
MQKKKNFFNILEMMMQQPGITEEVRATLLRNMQVLKNQKINLLICGATGVGKSSTINALFETELAKVGTGPAPETMDMHHFELDNLVIWDSPGLGDSPDQDRRHIQKIAAKLLETDAQGQPLIDLVLVLLDAGSRDLGTSYQLINEVIIPHLGDDKSRIIVAMNQADQAMKGRGWDHDRNQPGPILIDALETKVASVKQRIFDATGVNIQPVYFSAGYKDPFTGETQAPYNLSKLLYLIVKQTPQQKRVVYADKISQNEENFRSDDRQQDYQRETSKSIWDSVVSGAARGAEVGGAIYGTTGRVVGAVLGAVGGFFSGFFS